MKPLKHPFSTQVKEEVWKLVLEGHTHGLVYAVSITSDGRTAVSGGEDNTVRVWDVETGACQRVLEGHTGWVFGVSITPDGKRIVSGGEDNTVRVWDVETGQSERVLEGHTGSVYAVSITSDGRTAVSGGEDNTVRVWDVETGQCEHVFKEHTEDVHAVSITSDGSKVVSGGDDCYVRVWESTIDAETEFHAPLQEASTEESVSFTLTAPLTIVPSNIYVFNIWAHMPAQLSEALIRAKRIEGGRVISQSVDGVSVKKGTRVGIRLDIPSLVVNDPNAVLTWSGQIANAAFPIEVPSDTPHGKIHGTAFISIEGLEVQKLHFVLTVSDKASPIGQLETEEHRVRNAFLSFSHKDNDHVVERVYLIRKLVPTLKVYYFPHSVEAGERWREKIKSGILQCDVFYLFWSCAAKKSTWVEKEW
ncbi:MAG: TIR domain-containing protein, partial [Halobacteriota archaeon]